MLYTSNGITFPSLPVSTLYDTFILTQFYNIFGFAGTPECLLLKLIEFVFTVSV